MRLPWAEKLQGGVVRVVRVGEEEEYLQRLVLKVERATKNLETALETLRGVRSKTQGCDHHYADGRL